MRLKVLHHDNCFDGAASAAVFTRFYREHVNAGAEVFYEGLVHKPGAQPIDPAVFSADEHAVVDYRYSQDERLTWWFDHHQSAFQQPGDREHFQADRSGRKFYDPARKSCTGFLADTCRQRFGFDPRPMAELLHWAEIIDGALFESPRMAVELKEPALRLMTVLEANKDPALIPHVIAELQARSLDEIVQSARIATPLVALLARHQDAIALVQKRAHFERGVVWFDLADDGCDSVNKFIAYYLHPDARYSVWLGASEKRARISLGSNPWLPQLRTHDLSKIAERYGGGGHAAVAGVSFKPGEVERARDAFAEIRLELQS